MTIPADVASAAVSSGNDIATHIAAASAIAAAIAAIAAFLQVRASRNATLAELFVAFSDRYNSPEMAIALRELADWYRSTTEARFADWIAAKRLRQEDALRINRHRRLVSRFYLDVARMRCIALINDRYARELVQNNGLNVFYKICEPMNAANHPLRVQRYSKTLRNICRQYGDGSIHESAPAPRPASSSRTRQRAPIADGA